jgi:hypothetical protein
MSRRMLAAATLVLCGVVVGLGMAEVAARWAFDPTDPMYEPDPDLGWRHIPNRTARYTWSGWRFDPRPRILVHANSQGLLDREYPLQKAPGVRRVLVLADSFGGDVGVPFEALFPKVAEARANAEGRSPRYEVINAGVSGFGTAQELLMFRGAGWRYDPDVVVLSFYMNDVADNGERYVGRPRFRLTNGRLGPVTPPEPHAYAREVESLAPTRFLNAHSRLFRLVREEVVRSPVLRRLLARVHLINPRVLEVESWTRDALKIFLREEDPQVAAEWALTAALIRQLRDDVEARGARFAVMVAPTEGQVYPERFPALWTQYHAGREYDLEKPNRALAEFLTRERIPFLDLLPRLRAHARAGEPELYRPGDEHWTITAHALAGAALLDLLLREGLHRS